MKNFFCAALLLCAGAVMAAEIDLQSVKVYGHGTVKVTTDADGKAQASCLGLPSTPASAKMKNRYLNFSVNLPQPMDLTGRPISFKVRSSKPELLTGFFVRGYNTGAKGYSLGWSHFAPRAVIKEEYQTIQCYPGLTLGHMRWLPNNVDKDAPQSITRLQFFFCTQTPDTEIDLFIKDIQIADEPELELIKKFWSPVGEFSNFLKSYFQSNARIICQLEDNVPVLTLAGRSPKVPPKGRKTLYEAAIFQFAQPVSLQDRTLKMQVKVPENITMFIVRAYNKGSKKSDLSYAILHRSISHDTWVPITLGGENTKLDSINMSGNPVTEVDRIEIIMAVRAVDQDFQVQIKDIQ